MKVFGFLKKCLPSSHVLKQLHMSGLRVVKKLILLEPRITLFEESHSRGFKVFTSLNHEYDCLQEGSAAESTTRLNPSQRDFNVLLSLA